MVKKILIAFDGSTGAEAAVKDLVYAGLPKRAEAMVLTLADVWLPPAPLPGENVQPGYLHSPAHEDAAEAVREARNTAVYGARFVHGIFPDWTICNVAKADSPAWAIMDEAKRWGADLVVIGSHGRTPLEKFFLGSVSFKVASEAVCSVRVTRPRKGDLHKSRRILVGVDGSEDGRRAAEEVLSRHWRPRTEADLVTVVDPKMKSSILGRHGAARVEDWVETIFHELREKFAAKEIKTHFHILNGDPKNALLRHAEKWDVDCIFLGARGLDHGDRLYLGTLASAVCARAHCSVEIIRHRANR